MSSVYKVLLLTFGKILPVSYYPLGRFANKFRYFCAKKIVKEMGSNVNIEKGAIFQESLVIGNNSGIGINCVIGEAVTIGNNVMMGPECLVYTVNHKFNQETLKYEGFTDIRPVSIEDDVWLGARCTILPGVTIGKGTTVGANSVVTKDVPSYCVVAGNPAKVVKRLLV